MVYPLGVIDLAEGSRILVPATCLFFHSKWCMNTVTTLFLFPHLRASWPLFFKLLVSGWEVSLSELIGSREACFCVLTSFSEEVRLGNRFITIYGCTELEKTVSEQRQAFISPLMHTPLRYVTDVSWSLMCFESSPTPVPVFVSVVLFVSSPSVCFFYESGIYFSGIFSEDV